MRPVLQRMIYRTTIIGNSIWPVCRGVARRPGSGGAGRTRRHLLYRERQIGENCKKKSREISDCKFHMFASAIKTKS